MPKLSVTDTPAHVLRAGAAMVASSTPSNRPMGLPPYLAPPPCGAFFVRATAVIACDLETPSMQLSASGATARYLDRDFGPLCPYWTLSSGTRLSVKL